MREKLEYLSDEELEMLIGEIELSDEAVAPPEILEAVLEKLELAENETASDDVCDSVMEREKNIERPPRKGGIKINQFGRYCLRVSLTMAAALVLLILTPGLKALNKPDKSMPTKEEICGDDIMDRDEVIERENNKNRILNYLADSHYVSDLFN